MNDEPRFVVNGSSTELMQFGIFDNNRNLQVFTLLDEATAETLLVAVNAAYGL